MYENMPTTARQECGGNVMKIGFEMADDSRRLRMTAGKLGVTMIFHTILLDLLYALSGITEPLIWIIFGEYPGVLGPYAVKIISGIVDAAVYLVAFMLPVGFFFMISPRAMHRPMRLDVKVPRELWALILFAIGANTAASYVNHYFLTAVGMPQASSGVEAKDAVGIVLSFINVALVPAVCEEFLFRGCVLSSLLPYGKTTAIIGSAMMFALMHNNFWQFFYTFIAGIILGAVYVYTGSIWAGTFIHLFNNFSSVVLDAILERVAPERAAAISFLADAVFILAGLCTGAYLVIRNGKNKSAENGETVETGAVCQDTVKSFFAPSVIIYFVIAVGLAILREIPFS